MQNFIYLFLILTLFACKKNSAGEEQVVYSVTFKGNWNDQNHPDSFPNDDHFSAIVGIVHNQHVSLFQNGMLASTGIELMAETGSTDSLDLEINAMGTDKLYHLNLGGISTGTGNATSQFTANEAYPLVSFVSMIAPSPDWFIAINEYNLRPNGVWVDKVEVPVTAYDAGTEKGNYYSYYNDTINDEVPHLPISELNEDVIKNNGEIRPFGYFILEKFVVYTN